MTNGNEWWLIRDVNTSNKQYIRVHLDTIISDGNKKAFTYFYALFHRDMFVPESLSVEETPYNQLLYIDINRKKSIIQDLKKAIYGIDGRDSLFECIGKTLHMAHKKNKGGRVNETSKYLKSLFENTLYFIFRQLFILCFEDKHWDALSQHSEYPKISLRYMYHELDTAFSNGYSGWDSLQKLYKILDKGNENLFIPLLNGGLFDNDRAPMLELSCVMTNGELKNILDMFYKSKDGVDIYDYQSLFITELSRIYEGLVEFEFRITDEDMFYIAYKEKEKGQIKGYEGYFDQYDAQKIHSYKKKQVIEKRIYKKGEIYLVNTQNSRKESGSYYTPDILANPLVHRAINDHLERMDSSESVLDLRILDSSCGSGHLLVEALNYLASRARDRLDKDARLNALFLEEKVHLTNSYAAIGIKNITIDELVLLKRILLKHVIYGVDIQPFAIELTRLSLWLESFIFGTPLSIIEHHVKAGNALIGSSLEEFREALEQSTYKEPLLIIAINKQFTKLCEGYIELNSTMDITDHEICLSKEILKKKIEPHLKKLNILLNLLNYKKMLLAEGDTSAAKNIHIGMLGPELLEDKQPELQKKLYDYTQMYQFFNWELEFPEVFSSKNKGFDIVLGNPPWDKPRFEDPLFFDQYRSNYRSLPNSEKKKVQLELLDKPRIYQKYKEQKRRITTTNERYKSDFPLSAGTGSGNIFRFFIERNSTFLNKGGTLNYVIPTAFLTDNGSVALRKHVLTHMCLTRFDGFENREGIFPDIDQRYKFGLIQIKNTPPKANQSSKVRFMQVSPSILQTKEGRFTYSLQAVKMLSPQHWAFMEAGGGQKDIKLLTRFYERFTPLDPNWIDFRYELDATADKTIFLEYYKPGYLPLYKGASIWQYNSLYGKPEYWLNPKEFDEYLLNKEISRLIHEVYPQVKKENQKTNTKEKDVLMALGLTKRDDLAQFVRFDREFFRLVFRTIASDTNERTLIASVLPRNSGMQNSLLGSFLIKKYTIDHITNSIQINNCSLEQLLFIQVMLNSIILDWSLRFSVAMNVNKTFLMRQPMPQPTDNELKNNNIYSKMVYNSALLSLYYNKNGFAEITPILNINDKDIPKTEKQVDMLKIRNDVMIAKLYGVTKQEMEHMLSSFNVLKKKRPEYIAGLLAEI